MEAQLRTSSLDGRYQTTMKPVKRILTQRMMHSSSDRFQNKPIADDRRVFPIPQT
jgi:hypothetical protein